MLASTHEVVEMVNEFVLSRIPGEEKECLSSDSYCLADENVGIEVNWITVEFLNEIKCSTLYQNWLVTTNFLVTKKANSVTKTIYD